MDHRPYEEKAGTQDESPSRETRAFHSRDERLRKHGFAIWSRPKAAPPVWCRGGDLFTEKEANAICDRAEGTTVAGKPVRRKAT